VTGKRIGAFGSALAIYQRQSRSWPVKNTLLSLVPTNLRLGISTDAI